MSDPMLEALQGTVNANDLVPGTTRTHMETFKAALGILPGGGRWTRTPSGKIAPTAPTQAAIQAANPIASVTPPPVSAGGATPPPAFTQLPEGAAPVAPLPPALEGNGTVTTRDPWVDRWGAEVAPAVREAARKFGLQSTPVDYNAQGQAIDKDGNVVANAPSFEVYRDTVNQIVNAGRPAAPTPLTGEAGRVQSGITLEEMNANLVAKGYPALSGQKSLEEHQARYAEIMGGLGYDEKPAKIDEEDPEASLVGLIRMEEARKKDFFDKVEADLVKSAGERNILARARTATSQGYQDTTQRNSRDRGRYGLGESALASRHNLRTHQLAQGATASTTMNNARVQEYDRANDINNQLANNSRALMGMAASGYSNAAGLLNARKTGADTLAAQQQTGEISRKSDDYTSNMGVLSGAIGTTAGLASYYMSKNNYF